MDTPIVSITSAFYNVGPVLLDMVRSVFAQTFKNWELVLLDDGSTDESLQIAKSINDSRVRVFTNVRNLGIAKSLNKLTNLAVGKYIARHDADDMSAMDRIRRQFDFLESHPDVDVVGCDVVFLDENDNPLGRSLLGVSHAEICREPNRYYGIAHPTIFARRSWFVKNCYDERVQKSEDYSLFLKAYRTSKYANIPDPLFYYRLGYSFNLKKQLVFRRSHIKVVFDHHMRQRHYGNAFLYSMYQCMKFAAEVAYCALGAKDRLLARRYQQITSDEKKSYLQEIKRIKNTDIPVRL